jgi:hypothetical protein
LADGFFSGDVNAALSQPGGLNFDSAQLADYSLHLALKQTFEAYGLSLNLPPAAQTQVPASDGAATTAPADAAAPLAESGAAVPAGDASTATGDPVAANDEVAGSAKTALAS